MAMIETSEMNVIETDKIYVEKGDGTREIRKWTGYYSKEIAGLVVLPSGSRYEHIGFDKKDGVPIVREIPEIPFSELTKILEEKLKKEESKTILLLF